MKESHKYTGFLLNKKGKFCRLYTQYSEMYSEL